MMDDFAVLDFVWKQLLPQAADQIQVSKNGDDGDVTFNIGCWLAKKVKRVGS